MPLRIYYTDEDHKILQFVEEYGSITIKQCQNMFYNRQDKGYEMARRHLAKLTNYGKLKMAVRDFNCGGRNVYYINKKLNFHNLLTLDYYSNLIKHGAKIVYFKQEQPWLNNKYFSDAYCCYIIGNKVIFDIIEVVRTKNIEVDKYIQIFNSNEAHDLSKYIYNQLGGENLELFPHLIVIDDVKHKKKLYINDDIKVIQLNFNLDNFTNIFI
ncbi:hypothetical protein [Clostridium rectalis]|uniref:hypothetical protein n=1 Tax=Clostridium rectalis TaxID=2040295 RepID=UPI000F636D13|nr:hypothetical protein [Clostridium rectalis]